MHALIILGLVVAASAQVIWHSERFHGYRFELHAHHHLLLVRNSHQCHLVDVHGHTIPDLQDHDARKQFEKALMTQIKAHSGEVKVHIRDIRTKYHDIKAVVECLGHAVYELTYTQPSTN